MKQTDFKQRAKELVSQMTLSEKISQLCYNAPAIERLNVPEYNWWNEALHGVARCGVATVFPQAISMAASFDTDLMNRVASAISDEARAKYNQHKVMGNTKIYEGLTCWSPNINIFRDPRWGRGHETYGEDPYLTARMGTAFVKGLQEGDDLKYRKCDATLKHYAVHSGPESKRHSFNAVVNEKDLYKTYLYAFRRVIKEADPSAVMGAYNRTNGEACCASETLLQKILREEFGFEGYVVSDCGAICDIDNHHHITETRAQSAALAVNNGCQLNCGDAFPYLNAAVAAGLITEETITEAAELLFEARFRLGMFDDDCVYDEIPPSVIECKEHRDLSRKMAQETTVLLKNNGILPLNDTYGKTIAVIGPNADAVDVLIGNYNGIPSRYTTLLRGIQNAADELGANVVYTKGCHIFDKTDLTMGFGHGQNMVRDAVLTARQADVVILCMGLNPSMEGEEGDAYNGAASGDRDTLELPDVQKELIEAVLAEEIPTVFVNVSGSCVNLTDADENCDAVLQCFYPGAFGGDALADILFGKVSPSGRLPVTFYHSVDELPDFEDYSMENRTYRYFTGTPLYPFGYGLSYADITEKWDDDNCTLENRSDTESGYTVLRYDENGALAGFTRVHLLPHQKLTVTVPCDR